MAFFFENLDLKTREYMIREIDLDLSLGILFMSPRIRPGSESLYVSYLRAAARMHNETWMADQIRMNRLLKHEEERTSPSRGIVTLRVPLTAPDSLASSEFNRFYSRAICARAVDAGIPFVEVYRAKVIPQLVPESESMIGKRMPADLLLRQLRSAPALESALGLPGGPQSGVALRLVPRLERREPDAVHPS
ncbi:MAG: hypothetical protein HYU52_15425 [Acidobacteria bacterium]|nr:hypothetical protein [Acidobacteriota bacterium]